MANFGSVKYNYKNDIHINMNNKLYDSFVIQPYNSGLIITQENVESIGILLAIDKTYTVGVVKPSHDSILGYKKDVLTLVHKSSSFMSIGIDVETIPDDFIHV